MALLLAKTGPLLISPAQTSLMLNLKPQPFFLSQHPQACCNANETAGQFSLPPFNLRRCSRIGAFLEKSGKLHMIHPLSALHG